MPTRESRYIIFIIASAACFCGGWLFKKHIAITPFLESVGIASQINQDIANKSAVTLSGDQEALVIVAIGQSNAANSGEPKPRDPSPNILNLWEDRLYIAEAPLLGSSGVLSNIWPLVADELIAGKSVEKVIIANRAVGATPINYWSDETGLRHINNLADELAQQKLNPDLIVWVQGEADNRLNTPGKNYQESLEKLTRHTQAIWPDAPFFAALSTRCGMLKPNHVIRSTIIKLAHREDHIYALPDLDQFGPAYRYDGCHYSNEGAESIAKKWAETIQKNVLCADCQS